MFVTRQLWVLCRLRHKILNPSRSSSSLVGVSEPNPIWQPFIAPADTFDAASIAMNKKRKIASEKRHRLFQNANTSEGTNEEVLSFEVRALLQEAGNSSSQSLPESSNKAVKTNGAGDDVSEKQIPRHVSPGMVEPAEMGKEVELDIVELSSTGDGLAYNTERTHIVVVPFSIPGDRVLAKLYRWQGFYSLADFIKIINPSPKREGITPQCKYFASCSGCQFQMMSYDDQLEHKRKIIERAYQHFSSLKASQMPKVDPTMGSPLQYGYRTKLTPHFDGPRKKVPFVKTPDIGFNKKGTRTVLDIESCPIGTDIVQEGLKKERARVAENIKSFKQGATVLIRESTERIYKEPSGTEHPITNLLSPEDQHPVIPESKEDSIDPFTERPQIKHNFPRHTDVKTYTANEQDWCTEYVNDFAFTNRAGSFFQNNNSILGKFTSYISALCQPASNPSNTTSPSSPIKYLLDAYCGSGLFTVTLSGTFKSALGIDVDRRAIEAARRNAENNRVLNAGFIDADAAALFADVPFPSAQTLCVIDPPRKGASEDFLRQLCTFGPRRVVYVSCNVHTQARDVEMLVNGFGGTNDGESEEQKRTYFRYEIERIQGFDFFPQTGHVEGVCVLNRVEKHL